jgi:hypothetical protein
MIGRKIYPNLAISYKMKKYLKKNQASFYIFGYIVESCIDIWAFVCGVINMAITRGFGGILANLVCEDKKQQLGAREWSGGEI